jgi:hypothetical protein
MLRLATRQRQALGVTVRELANYGAAALIFGQFVSERAVSWPLAFAGVLLWLVFVVAALALEGE